MRVDQVDFVAVVEAEDSVAVAVVVVVLVVLAAVAVAAVAVDGENMIMVVAPQIVVLQVIVGCVFVLEEKIHSVVVFRAAR